MSATNWQHTFVSLHLIRRKEKEKKMAAITTTRKIKKEQLAKATETSYTTVSDVSVLTIISIPRGNSYFTRTNDRHDRHTCT